MAHKIIFQDEAQADLNSIYAFIRDKNESAQIAIQYIRRIEDYCLRLLTFPQRGTRRDDLLPGLRIIGFERRVAIAFQIIDDTILIVRVFYGGRDLAALLNENAALPGGESGDNDDSDLNEGD